MFSSVYKSLYYQRWFRDSCLKARIKTMRKNPFLYPEKQSFLDRIFGKRPVRSPKWR